MRGGELIQGRWSASVIKFKYSIQRMGFEWTESKNCEAEKIIDKIYYGFFEIGFGKLPYNKNNFYFHGSPCILLIDWELFLSYYYARSTVN